jgi:acyl-coenzyme A thioesterase PaaI-like protein
MIEPDQAHFESILWCSQIINDPDFIITPTFSRQPKPDTEDSLTAETLKRNEAIRACLSVYRRPLQGMTWINEVRSLMTLGTGMNGGPFILHGGIVAVLIDDVIGTLMTVNQDQELMPLSSGAVTAYLNVQFLNPVQTPQTVLVVARSREIKGRKFYMEAEIRDSDGNVLAKADSLWIRVKRPPQNL